MAQTTPSFHTADMLGFLDRWRDGDAAAAGALVAHTADRLQRLARRMYRGFPNVRVLADAEDVVQQSWVRLLHSLRTLRPANTREFYILAAVHIRRELIDLARRPRCRAPEHHPIQFACDIPADAGGNDLELWARFHEAVEGLPDDLREVLGLKFYHGWTAAQMAAAFGINVRTVNRWLEDAYLALRVKLGGALPSEKPLAG